MVQFPVFIQPYMQQKLILYQIEMLPISIIDFNNQAHSYTHLQVDRPYIVLNSDTHMTLRHQELRTCKNIGYDFHCEELFVSKQKSKYSYESARYFNLGSEIIKENCNFTYHFHKTNIKPAVLDGGNEIILDTWPNNKHIEFNINNDILVKIPSFPYVLLNTSVLCNCEIEVENHFLLESLAVCQDTKSKLVMYFMVNTAFINYFDNLIDSLKFPILLNQTTHKQTLPISLQSFDFDPDLLKSPKTLKDFVDQFQHKKETFDFQKKYNNGLDLAKENCFFNSYTVDIFLFVSAIISLVVTSIALFVICKHTNLKSLVTSLALQQLREVDAVTKQEHVSIIYAIECTCKIQWYAIYSLSLSY